MLDQDIKKYIDKSTLCWLATCDKDLVPNVSPKEMFTYLDDQTIVIANLASPNSVANIRINPHVCVSFVDIFAQKGYKLKGTARLIGRDDPGFGPKVKPLTDLFTDKFPVKSVIEITVTKTERIQAPSYFFFPDTTEEMQITAALNTYHVTNS